MTLKIGIVGASFAKAAYLPALNHIEGVEVTCLSSNRLESAKSCAEKFNIKNFYDNWEKMIEVSEDFFSKDIDRSQKFVNRTRNTIIFPKFFTN